MRVYMRLEAPYEFAEPDPATVIIGTQVGLTFFPDNTERDLLWSQLREIVAHAPAGMRWRFVVEVEA